MRTALILITSFALAFPALVFALNEAAADPLILCEGGRS